MNTKLYGALLLLGVLQAHNEMEKWGPFYFHESNINIFYKEKYLTVENLNHALWGSSNEKYVSKLLNIFCNIQHEGKGRLCGQYIVTEDSSKIIGMVVQQNEKKEKHFICIYYIEAWEEHVGYKKVTFYFNPRLLHHTADLNILFL